MGCNSSSNLDLSHPEGKTMKAVVFKKYGTPDELCLIDMPVPHSYDTKDQVLIKVHAASINPVDKIIVSGSMDLVKPVAAFPMVVSYDAAGTVAIADTNGVFKVGDEVMVRLFGPDAGVEKGTPYYRGSMAEYCVARTEYCAKKPANISFADAASAPLAGLTALQCLQNAGVKEGSKVLITGGAGGVGSFAIQIAKHVLKAGCVVTTASAGEKEALCRSLGADEVVDYHSQKFEEVYAGNKGQFDACFDTTAESAKMVSLTKKGGKIQTIAGVPTLECIRKIGGDSCILGLVIPKRETRAEYKAAVEAGCEWDYHFLTPSSENINQLAGYMAEGTVKATLDGVWNAETEWKKAFDRQFSGRAKGKCVVEFAK